MDEFIKKLIERLEGREKYYHECALDEIMENGHTLDSEGFLGKEDAYGDAISIVNHIAEECKEEGNLQSDKILFAYSDLLRRFRQAEESCIWELSGSIENDIKELEEECEQLLDGFNALLYSSYQYDNGWIACSERLPEVNGKYLVCIDNPTRNKKDCVFVFWFNAYEKEFEREHDLDYVLAWQPLPAPYKKGE